MNRIELPELNADMVLVQTPNKSRGKIIQTTFADVRIGEEFTFVKLGNVWTKIDEQVYVNRRGHRDSIHPSNNNRAVCFVRRS